MYAGPQKQQSSKKDVCQVSSKLFFTLVIVVNGHITTSASVIRPSQRNAKTKYVRIHVRRGIFARLLFLLLCPGQELS